MAQHRSCEILWHTFSGVGTRQEVGERAVATRAGSMRRGSSVCGSVLCGRGRRVALDVQGRDRWGGCNARVGLAAPGVGPPANGRDDGLRLCDGHSSAVSNVTVMDATGHMAGAGEGGEGNGDNDEGLGEEHVGAGSGKGRDSGDVTGTVREA